MNGEERPINHLTDLDVSDRSPVQSMSSAKATPLLAEAAAVVVENDAR
jgi:hypothetical protein